MQNTYDECAEAYARYRSNSEQLGLSSDLPLVYLLEFAGNLAGLNVLDAGCGEGYVSRILAERGAQVTAIDVSAPLIQMARNRNREATVNYRLHNLSKPLPQYREHFDLIISHMVLNDVPDYRGFISTLGSVIKPGGRAIFSLNNPYSAVLREKAEDYFEPGATIRYQGLSTIGIHVYHYHRTMEEYITAFSKNGFLLRNLSDVQPTGQTFAHQEELAKKLFHFPFLTVLEFVKN